jgi:hypothetical protein
MLLSGIVTVWASIFGISPGLALIVSAIGVLALDRYESALLDRITGRR